MVAPVGAAVGRVGVRQRQRAAALGRQAGRGVVHRLLEPAVELAPHEALAVLLAQLLAAAAPAATWNTGAVGLDEVEASYVTLCVMLSAITKSTKISQAKRHAECCSRSQTTQEQADVVPELRPGFFAGGFLAGAGRLAGALRGAPLG